MISKVGDHGLPCLMMAALHPSSPFIRSALRASPLSIRVLPLSHSYFLSFLPLRSSFSPLTSRLLRVNFHQLLTPRRTDVRVLSPLPLSRSRSVSAGPLPGSLLGGTQQSTKNSCPVARARLVGCVLVLARADTTRLSDVVCLPFAQWPVCVPCAGRVLRNKSEKNATTTQERPNKERNKKLCSIIVTRATTNLHHASSDAGGAARAARTAGGFAADACHGSCGGSRAVNSDDVAVVKGAVWSRVAA